MDLDLDDARDALEAALTRPRADRRALARHADLWAQRLDRPLPDGGALAFAALSLNARALVGLLVEAAWRSERMAAAVADADPPTRPFFEFAAAIGDWFPADAVADPTRREELLRRFAAFNGLGLVVGGQPEASARSARVLERLDFRVVAAEEARLAHERALAAALEAVNQKIKSGAPL